MEITVARVIKSLSERGINRLMILYRDDNGKMRSLLYQDYAFFETVGKHRYKLIAKPNNILRIINGLNDGTYRMVGKAIYNTPVDLKSVKVS